MKRSVLFISLFILFLLTACSTNKENASNDQLVIYTSIYPLQYVTQVIAGEEATVKSIYPPGVDAHTFEPTTKEVTQIAKGDAFIFLGEGMEGFAESTSKALESQDVLLLEIGEHKELFIEGTDDHHEAHGDDDHGHNHEDLDPHIWLDPIRMIEVGKIIKDTLVELNPERETQFEENFTGLKENMIKLDEEYTAILQSKENKKVIVTHAAYGYWEEKYGIEQIPISGISSSDEPSQKELTKIAKLAEQNNLQYVIFEQTGSNKLATIIQEYINAKKLTIHNLETLTEEDIENHEDYITLMEGNLRVLDEATQ
ncbi:zinc ABC transporter substrate-binding protein [Pseudogracilibacillus sp. SE30717A]|uniref:metal ABC transporter solute-binding protein, Zn/Mn family n=1 Tax=Pseudogracilibacillus sp. SE30717A TaxID=3098293 RepID=UPI00300E4527